MATQRYDAQELRTLLQRRKIATMADLKAALGTSVDLTVFRKLRELSYCTSYSHRGRFYTLNEIVQFNDIGLWSFRSVWFSQHGTLLSTAEALVDASEAGFYVGELENVLHVGVKAPLLKLATGVRVHRQKVSGRYLYLSPRPATRRQQLRARQVFEADQSKRSVGAGLRVVPDELKAAIVLFFSLLDEKQRRLYAGLEALKLGHGGDRRVAELVGLDGHTVARGRQELLQQDVEIDRTRRAGGGRKPLQKKPRKSSPRSKS